MPAHQQRHPQPRRSQDDFKEFYGDVPRLRGVPWLEPCDHVTADDLRACEQDQGVRAGEGDLLFVRVGHRRRRTETGPWDAARTRAGLGVPCVVAPLRLPRPPVAP
ncbi:hypothetical protein [Streptomyces sp. NPDC058398]|uniref:hypothetical protein n=1 Tax=Streptomyces sp. NPDC058398 TaxID=3346479 RepID=UPI00365742D5